MKTALKHGEQEDTTSEGSEESPYDASSSYSSNSLDDDAALRKPGGCCARGREVSAPSEVTGSSSYTDSKTQSSSLLMTASGVNRVSRGTNQTLVGVTASTTSRLAPATKQGNPRPATKTGTLSNVLLSS